MSLPANLLPDRVIVARKADESGNWGIPRYFDFGLSNIAPSVGWHYGPDDYFHLIWEVENEDKLAMLSYLEGEGWYQDEPQVFEGADIKLPSISSLSRWAGDTTGVVWAVNSSAPFEIVHQKITPSSARSGQTLDVEVFREGIIHLSQLSPGLEGTLIVEFRALENISQNNTVPFAPESREKDIFMGSDYFSPPTNAAQYKLKVSLRGIGVETAGLSTIPNWEIFRARLKAAPRMSPVEVVSSAQTRKGDPPNPTLLKRMEWEELRKLIKSKDFYIEKEYEIDLSDWTGDSVYIDFALLNNLPVEVNYAEEIRLHDASANDIEGALLTSTQRNDSDELQNKIERYALYPAFPNPFNPATTIAFDMPNNSFVELEIYDISGRKVRTLISHNLQAGSHQAVWDGRDEAGNQVASGVYLYRIQALPSENSGQPAFTSVNKMLLVR